MPGLLEQPALSPQISGTAYSVSAQHVFLDIDFLTRQIRGRTEILVQPYSKELKIIKLSCRQCVLTRLNVEGKSARITYNDPYSSINLHSSVGVHQHHLLRKRIERQLRSPPEEELIINLPKSVRIAELDPFSSAAGDVLLSRMNEVFDDKVDVEPTALLGTPTLKAEEGNSLLTPLKIVIEFYINHIRDGLHFVGVDPGDVRYPHVYSTNSRYAGTACALFPCVDDPLARCPWEISITCPRTLGDAFTKSKASTEDVAACAELHELSETRNSEEKQNGINKDGINRSLDSLSDEEKVMDLAVICSGNMTDEASAH